MNRSSVIHWDTWAYERIEKVAKIDCTKPWCYWFELPDGRFITLNFSNDSYAVRPGKVGEISSGYGIMQFLETFVLPHIQVRYMSTIPDYVVRRAGGFFRLSIVHGLVLVEDDRGIIPDETVERTRIDLIQYCKDNHLTYTWSPTCFFINTTEYVWR